MPDALLKKPVNLSINSSILQEAKTYNVNLSQAAERGIIRALADIKAAQWRMTNADAIQSYNAYVEKNGLPLAKYRQF